MGWFAIEARGDAAELFELGEAALDAIAQPVAHFVVGTRLLAAARRDHRFGALGLDQCHQFPAVIALVGQHVLGLEPRQQGGGLGDVVAFPTSEQEPHRSALVIDRQMDLGAQTSSGTPQSRVRAPPPFSGRRLCMRPDNAAVDHEVLVASIPGQTLENLLPDALGSPTGKALVHAFVGPIPRW